MEELVIKNISEEEPTRKSFSLHQGPYLEYQPDISNCKLGFLRHVSNFGWKNSRYSEEYQIQFINEILKNINSQVLFISAINKYTLDFFQKHFDVVYAVKIPIGYDKGFQYHILVSNPNKIGSYKERLDEEGVEYINTKFTKHDI